MESPSEAVGAHTIRQDMERNGFTKIATFVALTGLIRQEFISDEANHDINGNSYVEYRLTKTGVEWLMQNQDKLVLEGEPPAQAQAEDDEIPF